MTAARTVSRIRTRSTVKNPGETMPGAERRPMGPPISSVKFLSVGSLRLGMTSRTRRRCSGGFVSCMSLSLPGRPRLAVLRRAAGRADAWTGRPEWHWRLRGEPTRRRVGSLRISSEVSHQLSFGGRDSLSG